MKLKFIKIWEKLKGLFKQGLTPKQLALSLVVSALISIFPIFGIATLVLTAIAIPLKLNLPIMIVLSYVIEPLKLLLIIPFINIGSSVFGIEHTLLTYEAIQASYDASFWVTIKELSFELLCGFVGWALTAIPSGVVLYFVIKEILTFFKKYKAKSLKQST